MIKALSWAFDQKIRPATTKFVLVALANFSNEDWISCPSVSAIQRVTFLNRKTILESIRRLRDDLKLIRDTGERTGFTQSIPVYQILTPPQKL